MANVFLKPNETVILKQEGVTHLRVKSSSSAELMLTNMNIIWVNKGAFGNTKGTYYYPLNQIRMYNGRPHVACGRRFRGVATLDIYLINGTESFAFQNGGQSAVENWIAMINRLLGVNQNQYSGSTNRLAGTAAGAIAGGLAHAWNSIRNDFGLRNPQQQDLMSQNTASQPAPKKERPVIVDKCCKGCSAPLVGFKGTLVRCTYCNTEQVL